MIDSNNPQAPKIEFPCERYPGKVIGDAGAGRQAVTAMIGSNNPPAATSDFPCARYAGKVIGDGGEGFTGLVAEVIRRHAPDLDETSLVVRDSRNGRFLSLQILITGTGVD